MNKSERLAYYQALLDIERGVSCFFDEYAINAVCHVARTLRGFVRSPHLDDDPKSSSKE